MLAEVLKAMQRFEAISRKASILKVKFPWSSFRKPRLVKLRRQLNNGMTSTSCNPNSLSHSPTI